MMAEGAYAAAAAEPVSMTAAEAHALAEAEGLTLLSAENKTGFRNVKRHEGRDKPFSAPAGMPAAPLREAAPHRRAGDKAGAREGHDGDRARGLHRRV